MKRLHYVVMLILFIIFYYVYQHTLADVLCYHEQHHLFLYTANYFNHALASHGFISYLTDFVIQFFYYPWLGTLVMATILTAIYALTERILTLIAPRLTLLQLSVIPSILLLIYSETTSHNLDLIILTFLILCAICPILQITQWIRPIFPIYRAPLPSKRIWLLLPVGCLMGFSIIAYTTFVRQYNPKEGIMLKTEHYAQKGEWEKVLDYSNRYLQQGKNNQFFSYFRNMALYHLGLLPQHLFDYPPIGGVKELYLPWSGNGRESEYGHYLYEQLGYLNEAQRWEFESMVVWGETAPHLRNLARYNIAIGRPRVAQMFINKLAQSLFYQDEARQLEALRDGGVVPGLHNALKHVTDHPARFSNVLNIGPELEYLLQHDPKNRMAFEYLMCQLLLSNHVVRFAEDLKLMKNFSYPAMPPIFEEALMVYKTGVDDATFAKVGYDVSMETQQRFGRFYQLVQQRDMASLQSEFSHTYWFYLQFISPYGSSVIQDKGQTTELKGVKQL
ncbi:DUF6057 family protein [Prevotella sp. S7 MS 2]|uniref:DUF6057 family protein n=1 Tax=Prevotella sp. S7 MS 2 TaxID=1287488 RepID=UPI00055D13BA|nr:DUF6057 family protein [Prevotella sp. S7 MS 2]